jgi:phosphatidate cytidylyltransferase
MAASKVPSPPGVMGRLPKAVATAVLLLALVAGAYAIGRPAVFVLAVVVVLLALFEALDGIQRAGRRPVMLFGLLCGLALLAVAYAERPELFPVVAVATGIGALVLSLRPGRGRTPASDAAWTVLVVAWIGGGGAGAVSTLMLDPGGVALLVAFVLTVALDDVAAYFAGTTFGRHTLAPSISPAKSWEGVAAGFAGALVAGIVAGALLDELSVVAGLGLGIVCGVFAPMGDLIESLFKREVGIKDSGRLLPGHGGMLDRLDAIIFCALPVYLYFLLLGL